MGLLQQIRRRAAYVIGPALGLLAIIYFAYHVVHGGRGLLAWRQIDMAVAAARAELATLRSERQALEHRVRLLHPESLDADMLDETARRVLGYGRPEDIVIFTDSQDAP